MRVALCLGLVILQTGCIVECGGRLSDARHLQHINSVASVSPVFRTLASNRGIPCFSALRGGGAFFNELRCSDTSLAPSPVGALKLNPCPVRRCPTAFQQFNATEWGGLHQKLQQLRAKQGLDEGIRWMVPTRGGGNGNMETRPRFPSAPPRVSTAAISPRHSAAGARGSRRSSQAQCSPPPYPGTAADGSAPNPASVFQSARTEEQTGRPSGVSESFRANHPAAQAEGVGDVTGRGGRGGMAQSGGVPPPGAGGRGEAGGVMSGWKGASLRAGGGERWRLRVAPPVDGEGHISPDVRAIDRFQVRDWVESKFTMMMMMIGIYIYSQLQEESNFSKIGSY